VYLDQLCYQIIAGAEIGPDEIAEKENFRMHVEAICRDVVTRHEHNANGAHAFQPGTVELKCFGSLASGFATKAADMDLSLLSPMSRPLPDSPESPIPRLIEGALLTAGFGARLLTKTRIPIIKLCEKPDMSLRQSLLDARKKWENGLDQDERDGDEDVPDDPDDSLDTNSPIDTDAKNVRNSRISLPITGARSVSTRDEDLLSLKQSGNQSLASYYGNAKRLLRRLNGRDITHSNCQDFTEDDFLLLDKVACAFVNGLYDADLRSRILAYPSFHTGESTQQRNYRSLFGVNTILEGEKLVLSWETRQLSVGDPKREQAYESVIQRWKDLQYTKNFGTSPLWFNKELQLAVEALRQIPSLQILQLRQDQHESPIQYHARTNKIAIALSAAPPSFPGADICSQIIQHYVNGIRDENIRNTLHDFVTLTGTQALRTVARMHKSLHLAYDYERAIEKGLYRPEDLPILQSYISILRRTPVHSSQRPIDFEFLIPIMQNEVAVLDRMRQLPDPATLGPNKPKDRYSDSLEFPKSGVGVQCDVNFSAHLALQNTLLLRCYSYTDPRVRPLVLFVKHWAKARGINTPYRGTLSSYGYVLMVLHYLINVVEPFVCPNLQQLAPPDPDLPAEALEGITTCQGHNVRFWRDERAILNLAQQRQLNQNQDSLGTLLRGFFEYYAQANQMVTTSKRGFDWGRDVISLRTHGGLLSKVEKSWTGAKTVMQLQTGASPASAELDNTVSQSPSLKSNMTPSPDSAVQPVTEHMTKSKDLKEIRHRFLFAIEDPFELDHNVARTVTHNGIVAIRDEFRRAWRIIKAAGKGHVTEDLLEDVKVHKEQLEERQFMSLLNEIHGEEVFTDAIAT
jgi:terminal uridylyltransferase